MVITRTLLLMYMTGLKKTTTTENQISLVLSSKDTGYQAGFLGYFKSFANIVEIQHTYEQEHLVTATEFREALAADQPIQEFIPEHVSAEEIKKIFTN